MPLEDFPPSFAKIPRRVLLVGKYSPDPAKDGKYFLFANNLGGVSPYQVDGINLVHGIGNSNYESFVEVLDPRHPAIESGPLSKDSWFWNAGLGKKMDDDLFAQTPGATILNQLKSSCDGFVALMWNDFHALFGAFDAYLNEAGYLDSVGSPHPNPTSAIEDFMTATFGDERLRKGRTPAERDRYAEYLDHLENWRETLTDDWKKRIEHVRMVVRIAGSKPLRELILLEVLIKLFGHLRASLSTTLQARLKSSPEDAWAADLLAHIQKSGAKPHSFELHLLHALLTGDDSLPGVAGDPAAQQWLKAILVHVESPFYSRVCRPTLRLSSQERLRREEELVQIFRFCLLEGRLPAATDGISRSAGAPTFEKNGVLAAHNAGDRGWTDKLASLTRSHALLVKSCGPRLAVVVDDCVREFRRNFVPRCLGDSEFKFDDLASLFGAQGGSRHSSRSNAKARWIVALLCG